MLEFTENTAKDMVFGLDIGTRNVVGTVGYKDDDGFHVIAMYNKEHESRAMLDGQIHDIGRVAKAVGAVKAALEEEIGAKLTDVCIAAAGRVLKTVHTRIAHEYEQETVVTGEDIHTLELLGVDKAQSILQEENDTKYKFYCVGYSVVKYYLNGEVFSNLEGHKAEMIEEDIIATFLPEDVVDGLYSAVEAVGLSVANLTLEPIAAINVAIPEHFRMLNIALVDVGAGTSDICITRDGSIVAYGMIPCAGDELTEIIVQHYLCDFAMAEHIKLASTTEEKITFTDIMSLTHTISSKEVWELLKPQVESMAKQAAAKIKELNGDKSVSACFVVGGGGKVHGYTEVLAKELGIIQERVALRGEEVLGNIDFQTDDLAKDPLIVTPIGICLNYFDQKNNFIMVHFNDEMVKLYDNGELTVVDAAMAAGYDTDDLFPRRGKEINYTVNGSARIARGEAGESAIVTVNDKPASINTPLAPNCHIVITPSTAGEDATYTIGQLPEYGKELMYFEVNGKEIKCPKFVEVNGSLESGDYQIKEGDVIELRSYYTLAQLAKFMDVEVDDNYDMIVNGRTATMDTLVYENFQVEWSTDGFASVENDYKPVDESIRSTINVVVNGKPITLTGRPEYMFVDVFDAIGFNVNDKKGSSVALKWNGQNAGYTQPLSSGDTIEIYWED